MISHIKSCSGCLFISGKRTYSFLNWPPLKKNTHTKKTSLFAILIPPSLYTHMSYHHSEILENHCIFFPLGLSKYSRPKILFTLLLTRLLGPISPLPALACVQTAGVLVCFASFMLWVEQCPLKIHLFSGPHNVIFF